MIRQWIDGSFKRCSAIGLDPSRLPVPYDRIHPSLLTALRMKYEKLIAVWNDLFQRMFSLMNIGPAAVLLTDESGVLLDCLGDAPIQNMLGELGLAAGVRMEEERCGTNAVHLALTHQSPILLGGSDHYIVEWKRLSWYCVPYRFDEIGGLAGSVAVVCETETPNPFQLALLVNLVELSKKELLLRRSERERSLLHQLIAGDVKNGVIITDKEGLVTEFNEKAVKLTGCSREQALGNPLLAFPTIAKYAVEVHQKGSRFEDIEIVLEPSPENRRICLLDAVPLLDERRELQGGYLQLRDITERHIIQKQIIASEKLTAIDKLAAGLAHELRNPLTSVMGFFQMVREKNGWGGTNAKYLDLIHEELMMMKRLISDFVMMAKPGSPELKKIDVRELVWDTVGLMESQAILAGSSIHFWSSEESVMAQVDPFQLKQVLLNMIRNAIDAMPEGGIVEIATELVNARKEIKISVRDCGVGMTEEEMRQMLNPFYSTKENGIGLGLPVCYRIVENHRGRIGVTSQKGVGSCFAVFLPAEGE